MMKKSIQIFAFIAAIPFSVFPFVPTICQDTGAPGNLISPAGTETDASITLLWDKPIVYKNIKSYEIFCGNKNIGTSFKTNYTIKGLNSNTVYTIYLKAKDAAGKLSLASNTLEVKTKAKGKTFNILDFGAKGDNLTMNTKAIQSAIDACTPGGTVFIPSGTFISGPLFFKSNMTLFIAAGGVLKGSNNVKDYYPLIPNRFEGWEVKSFGSLITAGKLDKDGPYNITNLSICGEGTIEGGGQELGQAMIKAEGSRSRSRLICLMNCENIYIQGLKILNSPCWTIHYTYSKNVTCNGLTIENDAHNGDGINPDSSIDSYVINCSFSTGDDCIAIKSGKNPEGNIIAKPTINVRITDCVFTRGHSLAIGSELSGGVKNVFIQDCKIGALDNGIRIKTNKFRGGYVDNVKVKDCNLLKVLITTRYTPNNDGEAAPELSKVGNIEFSNLDMTEAPVNKALISIDGFEDPKYYFRNIVFKDVKLPENAAISLTYCDNVQFENVVNRKGLKPLYKIEKSTNIKH